jgi:hypothetical protein
MFEVHLVRSFTKQTNSVALVPRANYTHWMAATCRRNLVSTFVDRRVARGRRGGSPTVVNLSFTKFQKWWYGHFAWNLCITQILRFSRIETSYAITTHYSAKRGFIHSSVWMYLNSNLQELSLLRTVSSGMLRNVALARTDASEELASPSSGWWDSVN